MAIVYIAKNTLNGGEYIGCTKGSMARRRYVHERDARLGRGQGAFPKALRKHGPEAFTWSVHKEFATREDALVEEVRLINERRPRYNSTKGGEAEDFDFTKPPLQTITDEGAFTARNAGRIWYAIKAFDTQGIPLYSEPYIVASSGVA